MPDSLPRDRGGPTNAAELEYVPEDERRQLAELLRAALKLLEDT